MTKRVLYRLAVATITVALTISAVLLTRWALPYSSDLQVFTLSSIMGLLTFALGIVSGVLFKPEGL